MRKHPLQNLDDEVRDHIERETEENIANGMAPAEAHYAALRKFGNVMLAQEDARAVWIPVWLDQFHQDVRYTVRMLRRSPGFTAVAVATLAIGIGLTSAVFSVVDAVMLRPLPYADGDRIVIVRETYKGQAGNASVGHFLTWTAETDAFEHTSAGQGATFNLAAAGDAERVRGARVTPGYFNVAALPATLGRYFSQADVDVNPRLVVMSESLWRSHFGADASIIGRQIHLGAELFTVTAVAPAAYALTDPARANVTGAFSAQLWTPLTFSAAERASYGSHYLTILAKLKPSVTFQQAQEALQRVTEGIAKEHPDQMMGRGSTLVLLSEELTGGSRTELIVSLLAVGFVLLIACLNISSLLVARSAARRKEMAIRASIGGGRGRIVRQLLTESLVLAVTGGLAGLAVARIGTDFLVNNGPESLPRLREAGLNLDVLTFTLILSALAAIIFGLAPALRAARTDLQLSLRDGGKAVLGGTRDRLRTVLVVSEIVLTLMMLIATGLLVRSAARLSREPLGFDAHNVVTARIALPASRYQADEVVADAYRRMVSSLRGVPGVRYAAASTSIPLVGATGHASAMAEGSTIPAGSEPDPAIRIVTDDYTEAMGMSIAAGRSFQSIDMLPSSPRVVIVNQQLATALWPGQNAVGKHLSTWGAPNDPGWREVIGVVTDARSLGQNLPVETELFLPYTQVPFGGWNAFQRSMALVVRPRENWPETYVPSMRQAVRDVDASIPLYDVRTMENVMVDATASRRFYMRLILVLASTALGLAMLGIYGVISFFVAQRTSEIGLRLALGAERREVVQMVVAQGIRIVMMGAMVGVPAAFLLARAMRTLLYAITPSDPITFVSVVALLVLTTLLASFIPSVKAARVDPLIALKHD